MEGDDWEESAESSSDEEVVLGSTRVFKPMSFVRPTSLPHETEESYATNNATQTPEVPSAFKGFSKMARMYMQKNNFMGRLGKDETGITAPLEALKRKDGAGLGFVQEATSLPGNRAFEEETIKRRQQLELAKQQAQQRARIELDLANSWRKHPIITLAEEEENDVVYGKEYLAGLEQCESAWRERETRAMREVQVNNTLDSMRSKQMHENETDLQRVQHRLQELAKITALLRKLIETSSMDALQQALIEFKSLPQQTLQDFELDSVPFLFLDQFLFARFSLNAKECLEMAQFIQVEFYNHANGLLAQVLQTRVFSKLLDNNIPINQLAQVYRPWVEAFPNMFAREYFDSVLDLVFGSSTESLENLFVLLQDWVGVIGERSMQSEVANRLGERLAQSDLSTLNQWLNCALLSKQDFALLCECVLQPMVRENGGKFYMHCQYREVAIAAEYYLELKQHVPIVCLEDACIGGRLRHIFDYALELLRMAIDNKPLGNVNVGIFNAIEPQPTSFQHARAMFLLRSTSAKQVAGDGAVVGSLKNAVESLAMGLGIDFHPKLGQQVDGKQVYVFGPNCLCYFNQGVVYAKSTGEEWWKPVHINRLVEMSRAVL